MHVNIFYIQTWPSLWPVELMYHSVVRHLNRDISLCVCVGGWVCCLFLSLLSPSPKAKVNRAGVTHQVNRLSCIQALGMMTTINSQFEKTRKGVWVWVCVPVCLAICVRACYGDNL